MKTIIASGLIAMAVTQAHAEGFYQHVIETNYFNGTEIRVNAPSDFVTPLYQKLSDARIKKADANTIASTETDYTLLYKAVTGKGRAQGS